MLLSDKKIFNVQVGSFFYDVLLWDRSMSVLCGEDLAIDTETKKIIKGDPISPVIMQICAHDQRTIHVVLWRDMTFYLKKVFASNPKGSYVFHNAPFDLTVLGLEGELREEWLELITAGRIIDTGLRFILRNLVEGNGIMQWKLDLAAWKMLRLKVAKDEEIRLTFDQDMKLTERHIIYAAVDSAVTIQLLRSMPKAYNTEFTQLLGFIALSDIANRGMLVDVDYSRVIRKNLEKRVVDNSWITSLWGWYKGEKGNSEVIQQILRHLEKELGVKFPTTEKTAKIKMTEETIEMFGDYRHSFLDAYRAIESDEKVISNYLKEELIGTDGRVHCRFAPLVKTGRTSSSKPNLQNLPRKGGVRGIYLPPQGHVFYACDYSQLELCALAETCALRYGKSVMQDVINSGVDLHAWFGEKIMKACGGKPGDVDQHGEVIKWRQMAKATNFGRPGGMGVTRFIRSSYDTYGVVFDVDTAQMLMDLWMETFPEMKRHLQPERDLKSYRVMIDGKPQIVNDRYIARTVNGRVRCCATFCSACNYPFQGLAADGAKVALWYLYLERFRVVNFIHDETITELLVDGNLQDQYNRIDDLMLSGMRTVIKNTLVKVEGALMDRWYKEAEPVYNSSDEDERSLVIWTPTLVAESYAKGVTLYKPNGDPIEYKPPPAENEQDHLVEV